MKAAAKTRTSKPAVRKPSAKAVAVKGHAPAFREIVGLIQFARRRAFQAVNTELKDLMRGTSCVTAGDTKVAPPARQFQLSRHC